MSQHLQKIRICRVNLKIFYYSFLWPDEHAELNPDLKYKIKIIIYFLLTGIFSLLIAIHITLSVIHNEPVTAEHVAQVTAFLGTYYMLCWYVKQQHQIAVLFRDLSDFERFGEPPEFKKLNKRLDCWTKLSFGYVCAVITFYTIEKFVQRSECKRRRDEIGVDSSDCGLVVPLWSPFKIDSFPVFQIFLIVGYVVIMVHLKHCLLISVQVVQIVQHLILRFKHLKSLLLSYIDHNRELRHSKLSFLVAYHIEILKLAKRINAVFSTIMFGHFTITGFICATVEKQIIDGDNVYGGILHFIGWIFALFVGCLGGQFLSDSGMIIPEALLMSKWYQLDKKIQKDLFFILMRSQEYPYLRAGPFGVLGYPMFISVLKTSYSILCVLSS